MTTGVRCAAGSPLDRFFRHSHDQKADQEQPVADPNAGDAVGLGQNATKPGSDSKKEDDPEVVKTCPQGVFFFVAQISRKSSGAASEISDAHGGRVAVAMHLAERLYLHGAGKRYKGSGDHIQGMGNKSHDTKDQHFHKDNELAPVEHLAFL